MKKILIITLEFPPQVGGIATYVSQMAAGFPSDKVIVYATAQIGSGEFDVNQKYRILRKKPFFIIFWPKWLKMLWQIFWLVRKEKIEIIFINHILPVGYVGIIIKKLLKIPYLIFSHGTDIAYAAKTNWKLKMAKKIIYNSEQLIFNSQSLRNRFLRYAPEFENKSAVLYPCPNQSFFEKTSKTEIDLLKSKLALDGKKVALSVARFDEGKGLTHMVRLMPQILAKVPNFVWVAVGDGPKKKWLFEEVQKNSLQNVVRFIGSVPFNDLKKYYYLADLFILLTHPDEGREEGLGLVFLEASAAGLPLIAGRSGGVEEAVLHTETGLVVDAYQDLSVVSAIEQMIHNEEFAKKLGETAQARVVHDFNWQHQLSKLDKWLMGDENVNLKL